MMKRNVVLVLAVSLLGIMIGCKSSSCSMPGHGAGSFGLAEIQTDATYDIVGPIEGSGSHTYILGFIPTCLFSSDKKCGTFVGASCPFRAPFAVQEAAYNAIESNPEVDAILSPRWHVESNWYLLFSTSKATLKGKGVRYNISGE